MDKYQEFLENIQRKKLSALEKQLDRDERSLGDLTPWVEQLNPPVEEVNSAGGRQSKLNLDCTRITYPMIATLAKVFHEGKHYDTPGEPPNWKLIGSTDHLNHCINHIFMYLEYGDMEDLEHAYCRLAMAVDIKTHED